MAPKKGQSLAESRRKIEAERVNVELRKTARIKKIVCRRREELGVSPKRLTCLFKYLLLYSYYIVHDPALPLLPIP